MSIGLTCYTKLDVNETDKCIQLLEDKFPDIFPEKYSLHKGRAILPVSDDMGPITKESNSIKFEIAEGFNFKNPKSIFYIHAVDTTLEVGTREVADMIREVIGANNVLVLFENETRI